MANVLCVYENKIATVAGTENYYRELVEYDSRISVKFVSVLKLKNADLSWCDILYMIRPNNAVFARLAKNAHELGILAVSFLDDDLLHLPEGNADMPWRKNGLALAAKKTDIIVSTSPYVCKNYCRDFSIKRFFITDTAVPEQDIKKHIDKKNERVKIVYAAGLAHKALFDQFIRPILKVLDEKCGDRITLTFMGVHPELDTGEYRMPINFIDSLPFNEYRARIESENFDLGLAPLVTNEFTKCKYYNKFIEYAMFGIVGLYSDTEPYTFIISDRQNGILVGDSPEDWLKVLCNAIEDEDLIRTCRKNSYELLRDRFDSKRIMDQYIENLPELVLDHKNHQVTGIRLSAYKNIYRISRLGDWIYKSGHYFRKGGIKEVVKGIKRRFHTVRLGKV